MKLAIQSGSFEEQSASHSLLPSQGMSRFSPRNLKAGCNTTRYRYDGLYIVTKAQCVIGIKEHKICQVVLERIPGQQPLSEDPEYVSLWNLVNAKSGKAKESSSSSFMETGKVAGTTQGFYPIVSGAKLEELFSGASTQKRPLELSYETSAPVLKKTRVDTEAPVPTLEGRKKQMAGYARLPKGVIHSPRSSEPMVYIVLSVICLSMFCKKYPDPGSDF
ncbi:hypothetical protein MIND_00277700 [Mycena indigotica]|uniref:Uncharacterized protein n=1 Tax=Mycena indigotica TaxID=2126181 RepID=A0A8H6T826_9AGAR|nr:uncharacterized protein MIND_00277700 [Mycena indigotica]KAF7312636.1 hypothetical protein MIND_00277700 [Mycena indigotica]